MNDLLRQCVAGMVFGGLLVLAPVQAQEFRIGFVNTDRIFKEASTAKAAQAKAVEAFQDAAVKSRDTALEARSRFSLGNCAFREAERQRDGREGD